MPEKMRDHTREHLRGAGSGARCAAPRRTTLRRGLAVGGAALVAAAVITGCGTAQGALQPQRGPSTPVGSAASSPASPSAVGSAEPPAATQSESASSAGTPASPPKASTAPSATPGTKPGSHPTPSASLSAPAKPPKPAPGTPEPGGTPKPDPTQPPATPAPTATPAPAPPPPASGVSPALVSSTAQGGRTVALTFDDGPGPATGQILDVLAQYGAKATFCQIGPQAAANPAVVKRILAAGHRLCDHSVHHPQPFAALSHDRQVYEISAAKDMIVKAGGAGTKVPWFRAPGGGFTAENQRVAAEYGMRPLSWSVDTRDWTRPGSAAILATVQRELRPGGVILMHDGGGDRSQTVAALRQLLPWLTAQGYTFDFPAA
ncbi:polysaccharide deacetylase family protein [Kitasatospora sp. NPDC050543]|uniref:polysaccharide deacetylase family protein n=1 Tax=Kitasatospora sp. NPDC050543 TaxID=3364054 RepID=UPI00379513F6